MSAKDAHSEIREVGLPEIELVSPAKQEPCGQDASTGGSLEEKGARSIAHVADAGEQAPSNRRDDISRTTSGGARERGDVQLGTAAAGAASSRDQARMAMIGSGSQGSNGGRGGSGKNMSSAAAAPRRQGPGGADPSSKQEDKSSRVQDRSTRDKKQDRSTREDKRQDRSTRDRSATGERLGSSTRSQGGTARERVGSFVQRVASITVRHPKDPSKSGPQERPKPNANEVKLLDAANVSHDFFVSFAEVQWIANLSEGDMGEVHRVRWRGVDCAAKTAKGNMITGSNAQRSQVYKDMLKEIYIMSKLGHHPNIVGFFGVSMGPGGSPMILIELINGPTLDHFLASMEGMLPHWRKQRPTVAAWAKGLLKGVDFLHSRDPIILHRDIKPGNLLLSEGLRTLKIADFGVSRILKKQDRLKRSLTGMTGTRRYMAPEVYGCKQGIYTEKADIYSCSLVIWEMAIGQKPFNDVAPSELAQPRVREVLRPPLDNVDWKELAALIAKGWDRQAESRPSARQMYEELCTLNGMPDPNVDVSPMRSALSECLFAKADEGGGKQSRRAQEELARSR